MKIKRTIILDKVYVGFILIIIAFGCDQTNINISSKDWQYDVNYFSKHLPKVHKNLYFKLSENVFTKKIDLLKSQIGDLSHKEVLFNLMHIVSSVGDAHTNVNYPSWKFNLIPLYTYVCTDGLLILGAEEQFKYLIGKKILKINDTNIYDVYNKLASIIPHENKYWLAHKIPEYIINADILKFSSIVDSVDSVKVSYLDDGIVEEVDLKTRTSNHVSKINLIYYFDYLNLDLPIAWRVGNKYYWFEFFEEVQTIYFQYNQCVNMGSESFSHFSEKLFKLISENLVKNIIVDVRFNTGGDSKLFSKHFSPKLKVYAQQHKLNIFTVIGRRTFSSGLWAALDMKQNYNSILIGEPTGNKLNHYGDFRTFTLPKSRLSIDYSIRYWKLSDSDKDALYPDIPVNIESKDILNGKDACLENISKLINNSNIQSIN